MTNVRTNRVNWKIHYSMIWSILKDLSTKTKDAEYLGTLNVALVKAFQSEKQR